MHLMHIWITMSARIGHAVEPLLCHLGPLRRDKLGSEPRTGAPLAHGK